MLVSRGPGNLGLGAEGGQRALPPGEVLATEAGSGHAPIERERPSLQRKETLKWLRNEDSVTTT